MRISQESLDKVQRGLFVQLIQAVWLLNIANLGGDTERKLVAVAGTKARCPAAKRRATPTVAECKLLAAASAVVRGRGGERENRVF